MCEPPPASTTSMTSMLARLARAATAWRLAAIEWLCGLEHPYRAGELSRDELLRGLVPLQAWLGISGAAVAVVACSAVTTLVKAHLLAQGREAGALAFLVPSPRVLLQTFTRPSRGDGDE